jgi:uncharacterized DUF497 family protein
MFDWDRSNLRKIRAHRVSREEAEQAIRNSPIPIYEQDVEGEPRFVYYGETDAGRVLALIVTERGERLRVITAYDLDAGQKQDYLTRRSLGEGSSMKKRMDKSEIPPFRSKSEEADWWASQSGRDFVKRKSAEARAKGSKIGGAPLVDKLNKKHSIQIAIRLPQADIEQARKIAGRKGIGYQTLLKMLVHEGLEREAKR